ncbi:MAG: DUF928 domain-containing protein [Geitlerinemataceae cyanobacterium]
MFDSKKLLALAAGTAALIPALAPAAIATPIVFNTSEDVGAPSRTRGAGSRGGCNVEEGSVQLSLAAPVTSSIGKTVSETPSFYWAIEGELEAPIEFTLVEDGNPAPVFVESFSPDEVRDGMMSVQLPEGSELKEGKVYRWTVSMICNPSRRSADVFAQSWIERVNADVTPGASGVVAAQDYADANLWYDAMSALDLDSDRLAVMEVYSTPAL